MKQRTKLNINLLIISILISFLGITACSQKQPKYVMDSSYYTCPMHPEIKRDKPGICPICKMDLVEKQDQTTDSLQIAVADLVKPTYESILSSVATTSPQQKEVTMNVTANGIISYDTERLESVSSQISGRIVKLHLRYLYQPVQKGQKLFEVYSPEMVTEQENLLFLLSNDNSEKSMIAAAKQKLHLLGMTEKQIDDVVQGRKVQSSFSVYSRFAGYLIGNETQNSESKAGNSMTNSNTQPSNNQSLPIEEGSYIERGQTIFRLANNDVVWAKLKVYEKDISLVKLNQKVKIQFPNSNESTFNGILNFIEPFHTDGDKSLIARVYIPNKDQKIKIGQLVTGNISVVINSGLWVPRSAVLDLGNAKVVFLKIGKLFQAKAIKIGVETDSLTQIVSDINQTDTLALNAQYLTDSESFVKITH